MIHKTIGRFSSWIFLSMITLVFVSNVHDRNMTHNFDYRSAIEWEGSSINTNVQSIAAEKMMEEHALKGKKIPSLVLLIRADTQSKIMLETTIILKLDTVVKKKPEIFLKPKVNNPVLIPENENKQSVERDFEANNDVGFRTENGIEEKESKNTPALPPPAPSGLRLF